MTFKTQVLYPKEADTTFNMDYYTSKHLPLVEQSWKPFGLESWEVVDYHDFGAKGEPTPAKYAAAAFLTWKDKDSATAALKAAEAATVFGDIPNFYNGRPLLIGGEVVSSK